MRISTTKAFVGFLLCTCIVGSVQAQAPFYYPAKGQSPEQQKQDAAQCYVWASEQTKYNPAYPPTPPKGYVPPAPAQAGPDGSRIAGAARGAIIGAVVGEIANDDAGGGALAGAAGGAMMGGMKKRKRRRQKQAAEAQAKAASDADIAAYQKLVSDLAGGHGRALGVCMTGRAYTVG